MAEPESMTVQREFWNGWNASLRENDIQDVSRRQSEVVIGWLSRTNRSDLSILEVGCGSGWLCPQLAQFGHVTGTDLSDEVLARAEQRCPDVRFISGDFMSLDFDNGSFDVVVALEVLSHMADQRASVGKMLRHVRPGGLLMMSTQNRYVLETFNDIPPPAPGQLRRWVNRNELRALLEPTCDIVELFSVFPRANRGVMRIVNSKKVNRPIRAVFGDRVDRLKEAMWLGWNLMVLARKPLEGTSP